MIYVNTRAIIERQLNGFTEVVIQTRNKPGEKQCLELPGGQVNEYESLINALRREVYEETGLEVTYINGESDKIDTSIYKSDFMVECIKPFAVYQTTQGPVDSMGVYFRCNAKGELLETGDQSKDAKWVSIKELELLMSENPSMFSDIDKAGIIYYLKHC